MSTVPTTVRAFFPQFDYSNTNKSRFTNFPREPLINTTQLTPSSPASSHGLAGSNYGFDSESSYDLLVNSPPNSASSLRFTLSNNGSDGNSERSAWIHLERQTSPGGSTSSPPRAMTRVELLQEVALCKERLKSVSEGYVQPSPSHSAPPIARSAYASRQASSTVIPDLAVTGLNYNPQSPCIYLNDPRQQEALTSNARHARHRSKPFASSSDSQVLVDLAGNESPSIYTSGRENVPNRNELKHADLRGISDIQTVSTETSLDLEDVELITTQQNAVGATSRLNLDLYDDSISWPNQLLYAPYLLNDQRPLLGIPPDPPMGLTSFSRTPQYASQTSTTRRHLGVINSTGSELEVTNSNIQNLVGHTGMSISSIPNSKVTLHGNSTSSHFTSRVSDALSIGPATGPTRSSKRLFQEDQWDLAKSSSLGTKSSNIPGNAGDSLRIESAGASRRSKLSFSSERARKRARYEKPACINNNLYNHNSESEPQPDLTSSLKFMEAASSTREAEQFSPSSGSAEILGINDSGYSAHHLKAHLPQVLIDQHNTGPEDNPEDRYQLEEHSYPPDASDFNFNFVIASNHGASFGSPVFSINTDTMAEGSMGGDGSDNNSAFLDISSNNDISSNPVSPSDQGPVITPSESPDPIYYGPTIPPQAHLDIKQPSYNFFAAHSYDNQGTLVSNHDSGLGNSLEIWPPQPAMTLNWPTTCTYEAQYQVPIPPDDGEEYEAADEELDHPLDINLHGSTKRRRKAFDLDRRKAVNILRKRGACIRCQFLRECCDMGNPCSNCIKVDGKQKIWGNMPCLVMRITSAQLFRRGNSKFKQESAMILPIREWNINAGRKYLILGRPKPIAQKYWGPETKKKYPEIRIQCQEFIPRPEDLLCETWNEDGKEKKIFIPPFAACGIEDTSEAITLYVREAFDLFKADMTSEEHPPLVRLVFEEAIRFSEEHQCFKEGKQGKEQELCMLKDALKIWILTRLAYEGFEIYSGNEEFGVDAIDNPKSPYHGTVPIPPILDHQIDTVGIRYMIKLKEGVLKTLKARILKRKQIQWYEIFLTIFVLLHNLEYVYRKQNQYVRRHESTFLATGIKNIQFFTTTWMCEWEEAANMLIKHFQVALKGALPFTLNWERNDEGQGRETGDGVNTKKKGKGKRKAPSDSVAFNKERAGMDDPAVEFMKKVCAHVRDNQEEFKQLRDEGERRQYDRDMVWVSQLFLDVDGE